MEGKLTIITPAQASPSTLGPSAHMRPSPRPTISWAWWEFGEVKDASDVVRTRDIRMSNLWGTWIPGSPSLQERRLSFSC